jgi:thiosulfate/3-mercaptopyruvate sulfurtransferase
MTYTTLISATQLQALQSSDQPCMVFDCSFDLSHPQSGFTMYQESHIAGAVYAHLDLHLSAAKDPATGKAAAGTAASGGRHPLPTREAFAEWLRSVGFDNTMQAVVYDRQGANYCGRLWWMLKWAGHEAVAVLDGGLQAWQQAGGAVASGPQSQTTGSNFVLTPELIGLVTIETVADRVANQPSVDAAQTLIDARGAPRFRGEVEPLDPVAGHIPGALNRMFSLNIGPDGRFKPAAELRAEFDALLGGRDPATVVHHCGSGVSALPNLIAMEVAGLHGSSLFAGSWSEWCSDPARPVARGGKAHRHPSASRCPRCAQAVLQWLWANPLSTVTIPMPTANQLICAMVSDRDKRFCSWGIRSASATYTKLLEAITRK